MLPRDDQLACLNGMIDAATAPNPVDPVTFDDWMLRAMGEGITRLFLRPYSFKVWAFPAAEV